MKRLNIIFISEEENTNTVAEVFPVDMESQVNILNSMIKENPSIAEDPEVKQLLASSEAVKQIEIKAGIVNDEPVEGAPTAEGNEQAPAAGDGKDGKEKSPLSTLPFFKEDGTQAEPALNPDEIKKLTPETFHELASKLGVDPTKDGWVGETVLKLSKAQEPQTNSFEQQYKELSDSINALPKEVATIVNLAIEGKDWKSGITNASSIDLSKDFNSLSADEKIKVHNYYFPEDTISSGEDLTKKEISKSIKAAEAKYSADKFVAQESATKAENDRKESQRNFIASVDTAISELKKEYPDFREKDLKAAEELVKKGGIYHEFFDKNGNLKPDGFKKLIFAKHGESILKVATSIAENKGKSKGKSEVLEVEPGVDKSSGRGGTELTNLEKGVNKIVKESFIASGSGLTY